MNIFDPKARRHFFRLWSNWLALFAASAATWAVDNQATVLTWIEAVEQPWRSIGTFVVVAGLPILFRTLRQPGLHSDA